MSKFLKTTQTSDSIPYDNSNTNLQAETVRTAIDELSGNLTNVYNVVGEPTGFPNLTDSIISFNNGTRTFSISPSSTTFDVYIKGTKITINTTLTLTIPNTSGTYFIAIDSSGTLVYFTNFSTLIFKDYAYVANFYWSVTQSSILGLAEERHGLTMDWATHTYLHRNVGARTRPDVFEIGNFILNGSGTTDSELSASFENGILTDEDIDMTISHSNTPINPFEQILTTTAQLPIMYKSGSGEWFKTTATNYLVKSGTRLQYNQFSAGIWSATDANELNYIAMWVFATNFQDEPVRLILGQHQSSTIDDARTVNLYEDLNLSELPVQEFKVLYRLIFQTSTTYTNSLNGRLVEILDLRKTVDQGQIVTSVNDHGNLTGLNDDDHLQYLRTDGTRPLTGDLSLGSHNLTNVGTINGVSVELHASRHLPNGSDPLTTGIPSTIGTANSAGAANAFARQDHVHDHGNQTNPNHHAVATSSVNGFMSAADKSKLDGISGTRIFKSGTVAAVSFTGAPRTATVTFSTPFPNTNYSITVLGVNSRSWSFKSKTANGFVINTNANTALTGEVTWQCISHGETVE